MKEPVGVLHLVNQFTADGAVGQFLARLRAHPEGFRPVVACLQKAGPFLSALQLPVEEFRLAGSSAPAVILQLAAFMEREGVRLVHANDYYANLLAVPAARLVRAKVVCSRLDLRQWAFRAQRLAEGLILRGADAVMVNASVLREKCVREDGVPASKVFVVHNGVDVAAFGKRTPPEKPTVVAVANLHASKGHLELIEAASRMREVQFLCAGEGPMRPVLEQQ
ncbi:MAG: glycosyltransferase, partial [Myxococcales bacterium]